MDDLGLQLVIRTPYEVVLGLNVSSLRVPAETGQVGIRPHIEPLVIAVEPGLVLIRQAETLRFVGTAGGLLRCDGVRASLLTPLTVTGHSEEEVLSALEDILAAPHVELEVRATLGRLQSSILYELRQRAKERIRQLGETP